MATLLWSYSDDEGNKLTSVKDIVAKEVEVLACTYIEEKGERPSQEQIDEWIHKGLTAMGWFDDE